MNLGHLKIHCDILLVIIHHILRCSPTSYIQIHWSSPTLPLVDSLKKKKTRCRAPHPQTSKKPQPPHFSPRDTWCRSAPTTFLQKAPGCWESGTDWNWAIFGSFLRVWKWMKIWVISCYNVIYIYGIPQKDVNVNVGKSELNVAEVHVDVAFLAIFGESHGSRRCDRSRRSVHIWTVTDL